MEFFTKKGNIKKIIILIVAIILFNTFAPMYHVYAESDSDVGGDLFRPVCQFFASIGDLVIRGLQKIFLKSGTIYDGNYVIRYGPAAIFSNIIPGLDANFINPKYTPEHSLSISTLNVANPPEDFKNADALIDHAVYQNNQYFDRQSSQKWMNDIIDEILEQNNCPYKTTIKLAII